MAARRLALLRILDDLFRQFTDRHAGSLRGPAQQAGCLAWVAALPGYQHALGLLDHRHGRELRLQPGKQRHGEQVLRAQSGGLCLLCPDCLRPRPRGLGGMPGAFGT